MRTTAIVNQKGGSGKTTTAINIAAVYAKRGMRTLLVDMDPQSHCAVGLGVPEKMLDMTVAEALLAEHDDSFDDDALLWEVNRNLHLAPSTIRLATLEAPGGGLHERPDKDRRLESLLRRLAPRFDRCFIDCPPTIGLLTFNALRAARETIIPVETGFFALRGAEKQWQTIQRLIAHINQPIACHLLATLHNPNSKISCDILAALRRDFAGQIVPVVIETSEAMREATSFGQPILEYAPNDPTCRQYEQLADWLEEHGVNVTPEIEVVLRDETTTRSPSPTNSPPISPTSSSDRHHERADGFISERAVELARRVNNLAKKHLHDTRPGYSMTSPTASPTASPPSAPAPTSPAPSPYPDTTRHAPVTIAAPPPASLRTEHAPQPPPGATVSFAPPPVAPPHAPSPAAPSHVPPVAPLVVAPTATPIAEIVPDPRYRQVYGVHVTTRGVLFVQPADLGQTIAIAGAFNHWSPNATYMTLNRESGIFEARLRMYPGRHPYRLVIDGTWQTDVFNPLTEPNPHGELNSLIVVPVDTPGIERA